MTNNLVITLAGGSRGLGKEVLNEFAKKGFEKAAFHRAEKIPSLTNYYLDLDLDDSLENLEENLFFLLDQKKYDLYSIHFLSGGGLKINFEDYSYKSCNKVFFHNLTFQSCITSFLFNFAKKSTKKIDLFYYSSAVAKNYKGSPYYTAAKSGLEGLFRSAFLQRTSNIRMFLIRMGFVDIEHKYYHKLSIENPEAFNKILEDNLPSLYFTSPDEIARFSYDLYLKGNMMNGSICDLTGGHSWK